MKFFEEPKLAKPISSSPSLAQIHTRGWHITQFRLADTVNREAHDDRCNIDKQISGNTSEYGYEYQKYVEIQDKYI